MEPQSSTPPINPDQFINQIERLSEQTGHSRDVISRGHKYIYLNNANELKLFSSKREAAREGYHNTLGFNSIARISQEIMPNVSYEGQHRLAQALISLSRHNITNKQGRFAQENPVTNFFCRYISSLAPSTQVEETTIRLAQSLDPASRTSIEPAVMDRLNTFLPQAETAMRSNGGMYGVIFVQGAGQCEVFKLEGNTSNTICADRMLSAMGFKTPKEAAIRSDHPLGVLVRETISGTLPEPVDPRDAPVQWMAMIPQVLRRLATLEEEPGFITHMNLIEATSFKSVPLLETESTLQNRDARLEMGKMIFLDAFMGNDDRIGLDFRRDGTAICSALNLDNFMLNGEANRAADGFFSLIDSDFKLNEYSLDSAQARISALLGPTQAIDGFIEGVLTKMQGQRNEDLIRKARTDVLISGGMDEDQAIRLANAPLADDLEPRALSLAQQGFMLREPPENWSEMTAEEKGAFQAESLQLFKNDLIEGIKNGARAMAGLDDSDIRDLLNVPGMDVDINPLSVMQLRDDVRGLLRQAQA